VNILEADDYRFAKNCHNKFKQLSPLGVRSACILLPLDAKFAKLFVGFNMSFTWVKMELQSEAWSDGPATTIAYCNTSVWDAG
jgi:hypothetical protein